MGDIKDGGIPAMAGRGGGIACCREARAYKPISRFYGFTAQSLSGPAGWASASGKLPRRGEKRVRRAGRFKEGGAGRDAVPGAPAGFL